MSNFQQTDKADTRSREKRAKQTKKQKTNVAHDHTWCKRETQAARTRLILPCALACLKIWCRICGGICANSGSAITSCALASATKQHNQGEAGTIKSKAHVEVLDQERSDHRVQPLELLERLTATNLREIVREQARNLQTDF